MRPPTSYKATKDKASEAKDIIAQKASKTIQATKKKVGQIKDLAASTLRASDEKPYKDNEVGSLNPKCYELHLDLTLTLIPNQSYAKMH